jgi:hypothetical protein
MGILVIVALGAIIFALAQNQSLNQSQATVVAVQNTVTAQFNQLNGQATAGVETLTAANAQAADVQAQAITDAQLAAATALAAAVSNQQHAAATAQAQAVSDAQNVAASTQAALEQQSQDAAATAQANLDQQATANAVAQITATTQAQAIAEAQNDIATAQAMAQDIAATAQAAQNIAETQAALVATAQAQILFDATAQAQTASDAQAPLYLTITALQSQLEAASTQAASGPAATPSLPPDVAGDVTPAAGWKRLTGRGVAIQLPESFDNIDLTSTNTTALGDMLRNLGPEFESAATLIEQNPDLFVFMAFDNRSKSGLVSNVLILSQALPIEVPLKSMVDATVAQLPASIHVTENSVVQVGSREAGRIVTDNTLTTPSSKQVEYFFIESGRVYIVVFTTTADEFDSRLPVFEQAIASLEFIPGS